VQALRSIEVIQDQRRLTPARLGIALSHAPEEPCSLNSTSARPRCAPGYAPGRACDPHCAVSGALDSCRHRVATMYVMEALGDLPLRAAYERLAGWCACSGGRTSQALHNAYAIDMPAPDSLTRAP
jgi:hypothetical protein